VAIGDGSFGVVLGIGAVAGLGIFLLLRRGSTKSQGSARESTFTDPGTIKVPASVEEWIPIVEKVSPGFGVDLNTGRPVIPTNFVRAWLTVESGGNPCSIGSPWENFAQGPIESGPFQLMYPHDINQAGTTVAAMRANCAMPIPSFPGLSRNSSNAEKAQARAAAEAQARPLTEAERLKHVIAGLTYIASTMKLVDATGIGWSKTDPGYWALVKAHHGASSWPAAGVQLAKQGLGHIPKDWDELVRGVQATQHASAHDVAIANATKTMRLAFPSGSVSAAVSGYPRRSNRSERGVYGRTWRARAA
jgi:hypothetical protein